MTKAYKYRIPMKAALIIATVCSFAFLVLGITVLGEMYLYHKVFFALLPWWFVFTHWVYLKSMTPVKEKTNSLVFTGNVLLKGYSFKDKMKLVANPLEGTRTVVSFTNIFAVLPIDRGQNNAIDVVFLPQGMHVQHGIDIDELHWLRLNSKNYQSGDKLTQSVLSKSVNAVLLNGEFNEKNMSYWGVNRKQIEELGRLKTGLDKNLSVKLIICIILIIILIILKWYT